MSIQESSFIKWLAGICATLLVAMTIGAFSVLSSIDVMAERIRVNQSEIYETRETHKDDLKLIRNNITDIKASQKEIQSDVKSILKELK